MSSPVVASVGSAMTDTSDTVTKVSKKNSQPFDRQVQTDFPEFFKNSLKYVRKHLPFPSADGSVPPSRKRRRKSSGGRDRQATPTPKDVTLLPTEKKECVEVDEVTIVEARETEPQEQQQQQQGLIPVCDSTTSNLDYRSETKMDEDRAKKMGRVSDETEVTSTTTLDVGKGFVNGEIEEETPIRVLDQVEKPDEESNPLNSFSIGFSSTGEISPTFDKKFFHSSTKQNLKKPSDLKWIVLESLAPNGMEFPLSIPGKCVTNAKLEDVPDVVEVKINLVDLEGESADEVVCFDSPIRKFAPPQIFSDLESSFSAAGVSFKKNPPRGAKTHHRLVSASPEKNPPIIGASPQQLVWKAFGNIQFALVRGLLKCPLCDVLVANYGKMRDHVMAVHDEIKHFQCGFQNCTSAFSHRSSMRKHFKKCHQGNVSVQVIPFDMQRFLKSKKVSNVKVKKIQKDDLKKAVKPGDQLPTTPARVIDGYQFEVLSDNMLKCPICPKTLQSAEKIRNHIRGIHHRQKHLVCKVKNCGARFDWRSSIISHQLKAHGKNFGFDMVQVVPIHLGNYIRRKLLKIKLEESSLKEKDVKKEVEDKKMLNEKSLRICDKTSSGLSPAKSVINQSSRVNVNGKYNCPSCDFVTDKFSKLRSHAMAVHSEKKHFVCDFQNCHSSYKWKTAVFIHQKRAHSTEPELGMTKIRVIPFDMEAFLNPNKNKIEADNICPVCNKSFKFRGDLKKHCMGLHSNKKHYLCLIPGCMEKFRWSSGLSKHQRCVHGMKPCFSNIAKAKILPFNMASLLRLKETSNVVEVKKEKLSAGDAIKDILQRSLEIAKRRLVGKEECFSLLDIADWGQNLPSGSETEVAESEVFISPKPKRRLKSSISKEQLHVCDLCSKSFVNYSRLSEHVRIFHSPSEKIPSCASCSQSFSSPTAAKRHSKYCRGLNDVKPVVKKTSLNSNSQTLKISNIKLETTDQILEKSLNNFQTETLRVNLGEQKRESDFLSSQSESANIETKDKKSEIFDDSDSEYETILCHESNQVMNGPAKIQTDELGESEAVAEISASRENYDPQSPLILEDSFDEYPDFYSNEKNVNSDFKLKDKQSNFGYCSFESFPNNLKAVQNFNLSHKNKPQVMTQKHGALPEGDKSCDQEVDKVEKKRSEVIKSDGDNGFSRPFPCCFCSCSYSQYFNLKYHVRKKHPRRSCPSKSSFCESPKDFPDDISEIVTEESVNTSANGCYKITSDIPVTTLESSNSAVDNMKYKKDIGGFFVSITKDNSIECPICHKCFSGFLGLKQHTLRSHHKSYKPFRCQVGKCGKKFDQARTALRHIENVHRSRNFKKHIKPIPFHLGVFYKKCLLEAPTPPPLKENEKRESVVLSPEIPVALSLPQTRHSSPLVLEPFQDPYLSSSGSTNEAQLKDTFLESLTIESLLD